MFINVDRANGELINHTKCTPAVRAQYIADCNEGYDHNEELEPVDDAEWLKLFYMGMPVSMAVRVMVEKMQG